MIFVPFFHYLVMYSLYKKLATKILFSKKATSAGMLGQGLGQNLPIKPSLVCCALNFVKMMELLLDQQYFFKLTSGLNDIHKFKRVKKYSRMQPTGGYQLTFPQRRRII